MMKCEDVQRELEAFFSKDIDEPQKSEIQSHLDECQSCSQALQQLTKLSEALQAWQGIEPSPAMYEKLKVRMKAYESSRGKAFTYSFKFKAAFRFAEVAAIVALTLLISHLIQKPGPEVRDDLATINFYLTEHQEAVMRMVSADASSQPAARMYVGRKDVMYYEFIDDLPESARPGVILRGPSYRQEISSPSPPTLSKGQTLTLAQARKTVDFDPMAPARFHPGYILDSIRKVEGHSALHVLYTNGIDTISLFEQPLDGISGLGAEDFRKYAVYCSKGQGGSTILAWSDKGIFIVLIGKADMAQLMDMAQSISATNGRG